MKKQAGFTLTEILVSIVVLSIGLLGMAGLQVTGLRNNQTAYYRSQATILAYDLADKMRANGNGDYVNVGATPSLQASCLTTPGCTAAQMAEHDVAEWQNSIAAVLPLGIGSLAAIGTGFTVTLQWDDDKDGQVNGDDPSFQMNFQIR